jgi:hypothetical protein
MTLFNDYLFREQTNKAGEKHSLPPLPDKLPDADCGQHNRSAEKNESRGSTVQRTYVAYSARAEGAHPTTHNHASERQTSPNSALARQNTL